MKTLFVTGAASGIGRHLCERGLQEGFQVVGADINASALASLGAHHPGAPLETLTLDVTDPAAWIRAFDAATRRFGRVDVLLNVAGYLKPGYATELDATDTHRHFDVNVKGMVFGTREGAARMTSDSRGGQIINIASLAGLAPIPGLALYSASKAAARSFSLSAASELRARGVAVTVICPDAVKTPMLDLQKDYVQAAMTFSGPRLLSVEDVGRAVFEVAIPKRPLEVHLPRSRGWLAHLGNVFPALGFRVAPLLSRKGNARRVSYEKGER